MRSVRKLVLVGVCAGAVLGCGDSGTGPAPVNLVGTWHATSLRVTSVAHPANTVDLHAVGVTLQVVFTSNHTFTSTFTSPGNAPDVSTGTYAQTATSLTLTDDLSSGGDVLVFTLTSSAGALLLSGGPLDFDFGTGEEPSRLDLTLVH